MWTYRGMIFCRLNIRSLVKESGLKEANHFLSPSPFADDVFFCKIIFCVMSFSHNNCSLAGCFGEWRAPASVTSPVWRNPIHRNPFLIINQIHKYTQMTHTFFVTYECTQLLCVSLTRFYHDSFSFKENTYPVLNQRHISVDIRTAPFFTGANHARSRFSKPTLPQRAACFVLSHVTFLLSPPGNVFQEPGLARFLFDT